MVDPFAANMENIQLNIIEKKTWLICYQAFSELNSSYTYRNLIFGSKLKMNTN